MRIVVNGQQAFGKAVLEALLARGEDVIGVYSAPEKSGGRADPLTVAAKERGIPLYQPKSFKPPEVYEELRALAPDLCLMAYVVVLVPERILRLPARGTLQYHPSLLPRHRGPSSINWPIIRGETRTGLSIFWPDESLDTGPILLQKEVPIGPDDTLGSVYFDRLFPLGVAAMMEAVDLVKRGAAPRIAQDESQATYEGWCTSEVAKIDWTHPLGQIYNLIRGCNPQPGAWTTWNGRTLQLFDAVKIEGAAGTPGEVTSTDEVSFAVAASGGRIRILRARPEGGEKLAAGEIAKTGGITRGARLG